MLKKQPAKCEDNLQLLKNCYNMVTLTLVFDAVKCTSQTLYLSAADKASAITVLEDACGSLILEMDCTLQLFQMSGRLAVPRAKLGLTQTL